MNISKGNICPVRPPLYVYEQNIETWSARHACLYFIPDQCSFCFHKFFAVCKYTQGTYFRSQYLGEDIYIKIRLRCRWDVRGEECRDTLFLTSTSSFACFCFQPRIREKWSKQKLLNEKLHSAKPVLLWIITPFPDFDRLSNTCVTFRHTRLPVFEMSGFTCSQRWETIKNVYASCSHYVSFLSKCSVHRYSVLKKQLSTLEMSVGLCCGHF